MEKKTRYLLFCNKCGIPQLIPKYILQAYFISGVNGVYCSNCENHTIIPEYLKKIAGELLIHSAE
ncbi:MULTISPECIES: hypothetical protein [Bacillaceae]|uniref:hypothetical protein n=1 Tax=Bacillaceae TaxID=186817 RepID=UPI000A2ABB39|nr:hypothetical protein [Bacillus sp. OV166]SMQ86658.1 hypothetical protein SAMN05444673_6657 [Bacillus sp. OV166]